MSFLIAGVGVGSNPSSAFVSVVGEYTILVGLATAGLAAAAWTGASTQGSGTPTESSWGRAH